MDSLDIQNIFLSELKNGKSMNQTVQSNELEP